MNVLLYTNAGVLAHEAAIPANEPVPNVIVWGKRVFTHDPELTPAQNIDLRDGEKYRESGTVWVLTL